MISAQIFIAFFTVLCYNLWQIKHRNLNTETVVDPMPGSMAVFSFSGNNARYRISRRIRRYEFYAGSPMGARTRTFPSGDCAFIASTGDRRSPTQKRYIFPVRKTVRFWCLQGISPDPLVLLRCRSANHAGNGNMFIRIALWRYSRKRSVLIYETKDEKS